MQINQIYQSIGICLRKNSSNLNNLTASDLLDKFLVSNLISHDDDYDFLRAIMGSPSFWELKKKRNKQYD